MIEISGLTKQYGSGGGIRDLSFGVRGGEIVGLLGPNGAGKTTTLATIAGITRPSAGRITVGGFDLLTDPVRAKRTLAFVSDEPRLFEELTVDEHLTFYARVYGAPDGVARGRAMLEANGLGDRREAFPTQLSRGMVQTVSVVCALLHRPTALVLDEPLTGLDPMGMRRMRQTMIDAAAEGTAVLLSSHLLPLVESLCHRLVVMSRGRLIAQGTLDDIRAASRSAEGTSLEDVFVALTSQAATTDDPAGADASRRT